MKKHLGLEMCFPITFLDYVNVDIFSSPRPLFVVLNDTLDGGLTLGLGTVPSGRGSGTDSSDRGPPLGRRPHLLS